MTGNEISQILFSVFISYFGGKGHRPRWIAVGVLFSAVSCFVLASPQGFYGSGDDALALTEEYGYLYDKAYFMGFGGNENKDGNVHDPSEASFSSTISPPSTFLSECKKGRILSKFHKKIWISTKLLPL